MPLLAHLYTDIGGGGMLTRVADNLHKNHWGEIGSFIHGGKVRMADICVACN